MRPRTQANKNFWIHATAVAHNSFESACWKQFCAADYIANPACPTSKTRISSKMAMAPLRKRIVKLPRHVILPRSIPCRIIMMVAATITLVVPHDNIHLQELVQDQEINLSVVSTDAF